MHCAARVLRIDILVLTPCHAVFDGIPSRQSAVHCEGSSTSHWKMGNDHAQFGAKTSSSHSLLLAFTSNSGQEIDDRQFLNLFAIFDIDQGSSTRLNLFIDAFFLHVFLILCSIVQEDVANLVSLSYLYT